jgi:hypothetical protein
MKGRRTEAVAATPAAATSIASVAVPNAPGRLRPARLEPPISTRNTGLMLPVRGDQLADT